jgi:hypothetical protein
MSLFGKGEGGGSDPVPDASEKHGAVIGPGGDGDVETRIEGVVLAKGFQKPALPVAAVSTASETDGVE